jgi:GAF domain-containing protein
MKPHLSHTLLETVLRLSGAPPQTISRLSARSSTQLRAQSVGHPPPDHVVTRLERVFEALSDLSAQPSTAAALDLACDALQAELPTGTVAAGLYDIDCDEIRIVAARGPDHERLHGAVMPRGRCLVGYAAESAIIANGGSYGADWLGCSGEDATVLLCPIHHDTTLLGLLALADPLCTARFDQYDLELVGYVANQLGAFIHAHRHQP